MPKSKAAPSLASERYIALVRRMREHHGDAPGWQTRAAEQLGITQGYVSMLARGERRVVGLDTIEKAIARMHIPREYFFDPSASIEDPLVRHYTQHAVEKSVIEGFIASFDPDDPNAPTTEELEWLRRLRLETLRLDVTTSLIERLLREKRAQAAAKRASAAAPRDVAPEHTHGGKRRHR
jgi:transcriptional regulator with XRE-family HTH domain